MVVVVELVMQVTSCEIPGPRGQAEVRLFTTSSRAVRMWGETPWGKPSLMIGGTHRPMDENAVTPGCRAGNDSWRRCGIAGRASIGRCY